MRDLLLGLCLLCASAPAIAEPLACLARAARLQVGVTLIYDGSYQRLDYPGGDVPIVRGVCTDVVVRAYRKLGIDLQQRVHEDMRAHFGQYPRNWGLNRPDRNIDHRRVPNLATWFSRHGQSLGTRSADADFLPGDLVTWRLDNGLPHIGIVSERRADAGRPLILHNIGAGTREEDVLREYTLSGHYRYRPEPLPAECRE
ncbi:MAG: DUF1287 domain-containing protein [Xanthomonadales bacterium]|jgi:hypothetical protein|nr:DUF1287 domain-containing protein [Xanthomonadales bacterium]